MFVVILTTIGTWFLEFIFVAKVECFFLHRKKKNREMTANLKLHFIISQENWNNYLSSSNFAHTSGSRSLHLNLVVIFLVGWLYSFALSGSRTRVFHLFFGFGRTWGSLFQDLKKGVCIFYLILYQLYSMAFLSSPPGHAELLRTRLCFFSPCKRLLILLGVFFVTVSESCFMLHILSNKFCEWRLSMSLE